MSKVEMDMTEYNSILENKKLLEESLGRERELQVREETFKDILNLKLGSGLFKYKEFFNEFSKIVKKYFELKNE